MRHSRPRRRAPRLPVRRPATSGVRVPRRPGLVPAPATAAAAATAAALWLGVVLWAAAAVVAPVVADREGALVPAGCAGRGEGTRLILRNEFAETGGLGVNSSRRPDKTSLTS